jgi:hypothetical protein
MSSIEQKIAELLDESKKAEEQIETLEESEGWKKTAEEGEAEAAPVEEAPAEEEEAVAEAEESEEASEEVEEIEEGEMPPALKKAIEKKKKKDNGDDDDDDDDDDEDEKSEGYGKKKKGKMIKSGYGMDKAEVDRDDEEVVAEEAEEDEIAVDVSEDVEALLNGEELSEEFKQKATTIFETVVVSRVKSEVAKFKKELEESNAKSIDEAKESLVEKVDGYLSYVVEQWISENEIALESGMKSEILDGFIKGMKDLFTEHYIDVPEERFDLLADAQEKVEELQGKLDEQLEANVNLSKSVKEMERQEVLSKASDNMAETDKEKFAGLTEDLSFEDKESFEKKVNTIRESYFASKPSKTNVETVVTDEPVQLEEETKKSITDPKISAYADMLDRSNKNN